jgi:hypothetical protein
VTVLRTLRKLVLGETWLLPLGIAAVVLGVALIARPLLSDAWDRAGGFVLLVGVAGVLVASVSASARPPR